MIPPPSDGPVLVGFSGGLDSTVLLHRLLRAGESGAHGLRAVHVNHGLHADADAWAKHCAAVCDALGVPLDIVRVTVEDRGHGPEAAAREARYGVFAPRVPAAGCLALGHHRDDQAETVLLRALRASGPDGLAGMPATRRFGRGWLWRPFLDTPRAALRAYAQVHDLRWIDDPSNDCDAADRNFLRNRVLPLLRTRWPGADAALSTTAALQRETVDLLEGADATALADARTLQADVLRLDRLCAEPAARRARVLRRWLAALGLPPLPREGVRWLDSALEARLDRAPRFDWAGCRLQRWRDLLHAAPIRAPLPAGLALAWTASAPLVLPGGDRLLLDGPVDAAPAWRVHARRGGERIALPGRAHTHALKHVLQVLEIPPWVRTRLPLLSDPQGRLLAAGDLVFDRDFDAWLRAGGRRLVWEMAPRPGERTIA
nr:tRNA lysidine(34) synthetase TilS [Luteimonas deserti]